MLRILMRLLLSGKRPHPWWDHKEMSERWLSICPVTLSHTSGTVVKQHEDDASTHDHINITSSTAVS